MIPFMDDHELLREYVRDRSQDAFRELVDRHLPMVYGAARRMVRDSHLAEDVAQGVFRTLAEKAGTLRRQQVIAGWLYQTTRHLAMHAVRTEQRRREREQAAVAMQALEGADPHRWRRPDRTPGLRCGSGNRGRRATLGCSSSSIWRGAVIICT